MKPLSPNPRLYTHAKSLTKINRTMAYKQVCTIFIQVGTDLEFVNDSINIISSNLFKSKAKENFKLIQRSFPLPTD